jgi:hypothetical protein
VLLAEALSRRSGFANPDGSWMTQAEAIFATLVGQAAGHDLKAKRLLFDLLIKLQRANICWPQDRLPEIELDVSQGEAAAEIAADIDRLAVRMQRDAAARGLALPAPPPEAPAEVSAGDHADPLTPSPLA